MADDDCGHDLEAFQRQATELDVLRAAVTAGAEYRDELAELRGLYTDLNQRYDQILGELAEVRRRLDLATAAGRKALDERDQAIAELERVKPVIEAAKTWSYEPIGSYRAADHALAAAVVALEEVAADG